MPKVTARYRDAQRERILDAARTCFLRSGFHNTSMQQLFTESGLSSGAYYGYFRSKEDVILAIAEHNIGDILDLLRTMTAAGRDVSTGDALAEALELIRAKNQREGVASLVIQVWGEAMRNERLRVRFTSLVGDITDELAEVAAAHQKAGHLPRSVSARALAGVFISTVTGYIVQLGVLGPKAVADVPAAIRALWPDAVGSDPGD